MGKTADFVRKYYTKKHFIPDVVAGIIAAAGILVCGLALFSSAARMTLVFGVFISLGCAFMCWLSAWLVIVLIDFAVWSFNKPRVLFFIKGGLGFLVIGFLAYFVLFVPGSFNAIVGPIILLAIGWFVLSLLLGVFKWVYLEGGVIGILLLLLLLHFL